MSTDMLAEALNVDGLLALRTAIHSSANTTLSATLFHCTLPARLSLLEDFVKVMHCISTFSCCRAVGCTP